MSCWQSVAALYTLPYDPILYCGAPRVLLFSLNVNPTSIELTLSNIHPLKACLLFI